MTRPRLLACAVTVLLFVACVGSGEPAASPATDPPVRREAAPPQLSLYLPIPLDVPGVDDPATGVFVPDHYRVDKTIDLIVFLRGYDIKRPKAATGVAEYWNSPCHPVLKSFLLREEVNKSGKNVILVVPPLGPFAEAGKLEDEGGLRAFLDRVSDGLWRSGPHADLPQVPKVRHLILGAHSGGGAPLRRLARARVVLRDAASDGANLLELVRGLGFAELGLFEAAYGATFGETPLTTLQRAPGARFINP